MPRRTWPRPGGDPGLVKLFAKEVAVLRELDREGLLEHAVEAKAITREDIRAALAGERVDERQARVLRALVGTQGARWAALCPCGAEIHVGQGLQRFCEPCYLERRRAQHRARTQRFREKMAARRAPATKAEPPLLGACSFCGAPLAQERFGKKRFLYCRRRCVASDVVILAQESSTDSALVYASSDNKKPLSILGMKFGLLTVVKKAAVQYPGQDSRWECVCDCGARTVVRRSNLLSGNTKSCGCLKNPPRRLDLTGKRFGKLFVTGPAPDRISPQGRSYPAWTCRCDCGKFTDVTTYRLRAGDTRSCGCLRRSPLSP